MKKNRYLSKIVLLIAILAIVTFFGIESTKAKNEPIVGVNCTYNLEKMLTFDNGITKTEKYDKDKTSNPDMALYSQITVSNVNKEENNPWKDEDTTFMYRGKYFYPSMTNDKSINGPFARVDLGETISPNSCPTYLLRTTVEDTFTSAGEVHSFSQRKNSQDVTDKKLKDHLAGQFGKAVFLYKLSSSADETYNYTGSEKNEYCYYKTYHMNSEVDGNWYSVLKLYPNWEGKNTVYATYSGRNSDGEQVYYDGGWLQFFRWENQSSTVENNLKRGICPKYVVHTISSSGASGLGISITRNLATYDTLPSTKNSISGSKKVEVMVLDDLNTNVEDSGEKHEQSVKDFNSFSKMYSCLKYFFDGNGTCATEDIADWEKLTWLTETRNYCDKILPDLNVEGEQLDLCFEYEDSYQSWLDDGKIDDLAESGCSMLGKQTRKMIFWALDVVKYGSVILLIVLGMLDFTKAVTSSEADALKKAGQKFLRRLIVVVLMFVLPYLLEFVLRMLNVDGVNLDNPLCK